MKNQYMTDGQFHGALKTGDTQGKRFTDDQWRAVLKEVWRKRGQVYGKVLSLYVQWRCPSRYGTLH